MLKDIFKRYLLSLTTVRIISHTRLTESPNTFHVRLCHSLTMSESLCQFCPCSTKASFITDAYSGWLKDTVVDMVLSLSFWPPTVVSIGLDGRNGLALSPAPKRPPNYCNCIWLTYPCHGDWFRRAWPQSSGTLDSPGNRTGSETNCG